MAVQLVVVDSTLAVDSTWEACIISQRQLSILRTGRQCLNWYLREVEAQEQQRLMKALACLLTPLL